MKKICVFMIAVILICISNCAFAEEKKDGYIQNCFAQVMSEEKKYPDENAKITRAEFVAVIMKVINSTEDVYVCSFYDIYDASWEYKYIANAQRKKIALGTHDGAFLPDEFITTEEAVTFLARAYRVDSNLYLTNYERQNFKISQYAKGYAEYAIQNDIYPKNGQNLKSPKAELSVFEALSMIEAFDRLDGVGIDFISFMDGYPKIVETGRLSSIGVMIKANKPCDVFYEIIPSENLSGSYKPLRESVDNFLVSVDDADSGVNVLIDAKPGVRYNIYFTAVDENGVISRVKSLINVSLLPYTQGKGTEDEPYKIYTRYQLDQVRYYPDKCFVLANDIEFDGEWTPIGDAEDNSTQFSGVFDGNGHKISGLSISANEKCGVFSVIKAGTVRNLYVSADVKAENTIGIITGELRGGVIENCHVSGTVYAWGNIAGGVVGKNNGTIRNCVSAVYFVESAAYSGGICGTSTGEIDSCISAVEKIRSDMYSSSISGANIGGTVKNCVGASIEVYDSMTKNSGRITTNKENGTTYNNYAYTDMIAGENVYLGKDRPDGEDISWDMLCTEGFYTDIVGWDFEKRWTLDAYPEFCLPVIKNVTIPKLEKGRTVYAPLGISDVQGLMAISENLSGHYYLENDIVLEKVLEYESNWTPLGLKKEDDTSEVTGFSGTFDGRGYTIRGLQLSFDSKNCQYGLFAKIYGGTVRNLRLSDVLINGHTKIGALAAENYGTVDNCFVSGKIIADGLEKSTTAGGILGVNYANIYSCESEADIEIVTSVATAGGVVGHNEGFIYDCSNYSDILCNQKAADSNIIIGGISGINYSGFIYDCFGGKSIKSTAYTNYCGGIVGLCEGGEVYKCSSLVTINVNSNNEQNSVSYTGGIAGMMSNGLIMNSFSVGNLFTRDNRSYTGGIAGYIENSSIQNCYSLNTVNQIGGIYDENSFEAYAGGISGYSQTVSIYGCVAINPYIMTNGYYANISAYSDGGFVDNNYCYDRIYSTAQKGEFYLDGVDKSLNELKNIQFYFKPVETGGLLGWVNSEYTEDSDGWIKSGRRNYSFPVLENVKKQNLFFEPSELK